MNFFKFFLFVSILGFIGCGEESTIKQSKIGKEKNTKLVINDSVQLAQFLSYFETIETVDFRGEDHFNLSNFEKLRDTNLIHEILLSIQITIGTYNEFPYRPIELTNYTHLIDLNDDNELDVIYEGPSGGESDMTVIFMANNGGFEEVFRNYQRIFKLEFNAKKLSKIAIFNPGCCADPHVVNSYFKVSFISNKPTFVCVKKEGYLTLREKPMSYFKKKKIFQTIDSEVVLRNQCFVLQRNIEDYGMLSNEISRYSKGAFGWALGSKTVKGENWYYVLMQPNKRVKTKDSYFPEKSIFLYGWVREVDVKF